jgi:transposase
MLASPDANTTDRRPVGQDPTPPATAGPHRPPRADDRRTLEAILYVLRAGSAWADLPTDLGDDATAHRRLRRWQDAGVWDRIRQALLAELDAAGGIDWSAALLDGSFAPARGGGAGVGLTGKGKGTRLMLATDAAGAPLGLLTTSANVAEVRVAEAALSTIRVPRPRGGPRTRLAQLVADWAYDSRPLRRRLRARGIRLCIPPRRRPASWRPACGRPRSPFPEEYARRWPVERTFAWLGHQRRLLVRHERLPEVYHTFFTVACALVVLKALLG